MVDWIAYAEREILTQYGDVVSVARRSKSLLKFGQNDNVGTTELTIMDLQGTETEETYVSDNLIDRVVSDKVANTQTITIEGHTLSGGDLTFVIQTAVLTGQTPVVLTTPLARVSRVYVTGATPLVATSIVFVYESTGGETLGVPDDDSTVHITMTDVHNQSVKAATSVSAVDYLLITSIYGDINKKTGSEIDLQFKSRVLGNIFRPHAPRSGDSAGTSSLSLPFMPYIIIPPNSDIIMTAKAGTISVSVSAGFEGIFAIKL